MLNPLLLVVIICILLFLPGISVLKLFKSKIDGLERFVAGVGISLAIIPFYSLLLDQIKLTYNNLFILLTPFIGLIVYTLIRDNPRKEKKTLNKYSKSWDKYSLLLLFIFSLTLSIGLYSVLELQPWLKNTDGPVYGWTIKYISENGIMNNDWTIHDFAEVTSQPYPIGYSIWNSLLYSSGIPLSVTLKFFTALLNSLNILFIYYISFNLFKNKNGALAAAFIFSMFNSFPFRDYPWMIHGEQLAFVLLLSAIYFFTKGDSKNWYFGGLCFGGVLITNHLVSFFAIIFILMYILVFFVAPSPRKQNFKDFFCSLLLGTVLAFSLYWIPTIYYLGLKEFLWFLFGIDLNAFLQGHPNILSSPGAVQASWFDMENSGIVFYVGGAIRFLALLSLLGFLISRNFKREQIYLWIILFFPIAFSLSGYIRLPFPTDRPLVYILAILSILSGISIANLYEHLTNTKLNVKHKIYLIAAFIFICVQSLFPLARLLRMEGAKAYEVRMLEAYAPNLISIYLPAATVVIILLIAIAIVLKILKNKSISSKTITIFLILIILLTYIQISVIPFFLSLGINPIVGKTQPYMPWRPSVDGVDFSEFDNLRFLSNTDLKVLPYSSRNYDPVKKTVSTKLWFTKLDLVSSLDINVITSLKVWNEVYDIIHRYQKNEITYNEFILQLKKYKIDYLLMINYEGSSAAVIAGLKPVFQTEHLLLYDLRNIPEKGVNVSLVNTSTWRINYGTPSIKNGLLILKPDVDIRSKQLFKNAIFEIYAKSEFPANTISAFGFISNSSNNIIFENSQYIFPNNLSVKVHNNNMELAGEFTVNVTQWHKYRIEWNQNSANFSIDEGETIRIINNAPTGELPVRLFVYSHPNTLYVDWIKVYDNSGNILLYDNFT